MRHHVLLRSTAGLALVALAACGRHEPPPKPPTPVRVAQVERHAGDHALRYSAAVEPVSRVDLAFRVGGYVTTLARVGGRAIQDGDRVARGMVLASVRQEDYDAKVRQGQAALAEATAARGAATQALTRAESLYGSRSLTRPELEQARAAVETIDAKIAGAKALVREAELARGDADLRSPIEGVLLKRLVEAGNLVGPGTPGFILADTRTVKVVIGVPDTMLGRFRAGDVEHVTFDALHDSPYRGTVTKISPTADPRSRLFEVELTLTNPDGAVKPGMVATVEVARAGAPAASAALSVPLSAVVRAPGENAGYAVFVVGRGGGGVATARLRRVRLGDLLGNRIAVADGLTAGEEIIVAGATMVVDGERVNPAR